MVLSTIRRLSRAQGSAIGVILPTVAGCALLQRLPADRMPGLDSSEPLRLTPHRWNFDGEHVGAVPRHWTISQTHPTMELAHWQIVTDPAAPSPPNTLAVTQSANYAVTGNLAIARNTRYRDVHLRVKMQSSTGGAHHGAGPIWRYIDPEHYYACRFDPASADFEVFKVIDGQRVALGSALAATDPLHWCTLEITMVGSRMTCALNGSVLLEITDDALARPGMIGLWTQADTLAAFDDLEVSAVLPAPAPHAPTD